MQKLKNWIIGLCGGYTPQEKEYAIARAFENGIEVGRQQIGLPPRVFSTYSVQTVALKKPRKKKK